MAHILRKFKKDDSKGVKELILTILANEYPFDRSAYSDSDLEKIADVYGGEKDSFFVAEEDAEIVGTAGIKKETDDEAILRRVFVDPKYRRRGYGGALIDLAVDFCRDKGYKKIFFRCTDRMAEAMKLCLKKGFKEKEKLEVGGFGIHVLELSL